MKDGIPKVIHYCWFGGNPLGEKELACIESWKKFLPGYEIKRWVRRVGRVFGKSSSPQINDLGRACETGVGFDQGKI